MSDSLKPVPKVAAGISWSAFASVSVGAVAVFYPDAYAKLTPDFAISLGVLLGSVAGTLPAYMKRG
jgi:hypothetical protein